MIHLIIYKIVAWHNFFFLFYLVKENGVEYFTEIGSGKYESLILLPKKKKKDIHLVIPKTRGS